MDPQQLGLQFKKPIPIILLTVIKLLIIPLILYAVTNIIYLSLAIPVLLLSGISTGLGAPFVINAPNFGMNHSFNPLSLCISWYQNYEGNVKHLVTCSILKIFLKKEMKIIPLLHCFNN